MTLRACTVSYRIETDGKSQFARELLNTTEHESTRTNTARPIDRRQVAHLVWRGICLAPARNGLLPPTALVNHNQS